MVNSSLGDAFLIGFCSLPSGNPETFFETEIKRRLFDKYREGLIKNSVKNDGTEENFNGLFVPEAYYLWGKYDVCVLAKVDDLEFATRFFRSYNPMGENIGEEMQKFDYKVLIGIDPLIHTTRTTDTAGAFLPLPYIAISQLKINSAFLIGTGITLIEKIKRYILNVIKTETKDPLHITDFKICESYSYHELIVVLHGNSIKTLKNIVMQMRGTRFCDLVKNDKSFDWNQLLKDSLFPNLLKKEITLNAKKIENHIFESTLTTFGTHTELFNTQSKFSTKNKVIQPIKGESIELFSRWTIKPGHMNKVKEILADCRKGKGTYQEKKSITNVSASHKKINMGKEHVIMGKGDMMISKTIEIKDYSSYRYLDYPSIIFKATSQNNKLSPLCDHVIDIFTTLGRPIEEKEAVLDNGFLSKHHYEIHNRLKDFTVDSDAIFNLQKQMKSFWVPKVLAEKVLKLVSNYNCAIQNPDMYAFYIELYPYIHDGFIETVKHYSENKNRHQFKTRILYKKLENVCHNLESGFQNRFYQSYWTSDIPEVNIDYSGGIHNLISAYDACFKSLNNTFKFLQQDTAFVFVKSESQVDASFDTLKMNYLHLIQPLIFCSVAPHESCNFALEKWYLSQASIPANKTNELEEKIRKKKLDRLVQLLYQAEIEFNSPNLLNSEEEVNKVVQKTTKLFSKNNIEDKRTTISQKNHEEDKSDSGQEANARQEGTITNDGYSKQENNTKQENEARKNEYFPQKSDMSFQKKLQDFGDRLTTNIAVQINSNLLRYYTVDRLNFECSFNKDYISFRNTYWNYALQSGYVYSRPQEMEARYFVTMALRLAILKFSTAKGRTIQFDEFLEIFPQTDALKSLREKFEQSIFILVTWLFNTDTELKKWFVDWENLLEDPEIPIIPKSTGKIFNDFSEQIKKYFEDTNEDTDSHSDNTVNPSTKIEEFLKYVAPLIQNKDCTNCTSELYINLIHEFLQLELNSNLTVMERTYDGIAKVELEKINLDPIGGTFASGEKFRKKYLAQRVKFLKLFYHLSQLHKKNYASQILEEKRAK